MAHVLEGILNNIRIEVQTGTREVVREGDYISGAWDARGKAYRTGEGRAIALDVLNPFLDQVRISDAVLKFTERLGPLTIPFDSGASFRFSIREWIAARRGLQWVWKATSSGMKLSRNYDLPVKESDRDHFSFEKGNRITFRTHKLSTFIALEIATIPANMFRRCANFGYGCKSPFFIAGDRREKYCSESCAHEGRKRAKLKWWDENRKEK